MNAPATCFRCDWQGETDGEACPRCATPLVRPEPTKSRTAAQQAPPSLPRSGDATPRPEFLPGSTPPDDPASRSPRRSGRFAVFAVLAALVTAALWSFLRSHEVAPPEEAGSPPPSGSLVYTAAGEGGAGLWSWDPRTGLVSQGPTIDAEVVQLVSAQGALAGWLGITTSTPGGRLEASILRSRSPGARPDHVLTGDLVAWGPNGATVVSTRLGSPANGCHRSLAIHREQIAARLLERALVRRTRGCLDVPTLGQTLASTYFTWERPGGTGIFFVGNGDPHAILRGWTLLSTSPTSDLLVQPADGPGTALFWRGAAAPDPYRGAGGGSVAVREVLAWTAGADGALVVGAVDEREGLFLLDTTPGGSRMPVYVGLARGPVVATAAFDGSLYVAMEGQLLVYRDGRLTEADLPEGAPRPAGPMAWMPGEGYTAAG